LTGKNEDLLFDRMIRELDRTVAEKLHRRGSSIYDINVSGMMPT